MGNRNWQWLPNFITLVRCGAAIGLGLALYWAIAAPTWLSQPSGLVWIFWGFLVTASSDFVDGYLARRLNAVSAFGAFLDPIADKLLVGACLIPLAFHSGWALVLALPTGVIIARDTLITLLRLHPNISLPVVRLAKYKTALEMLSIALILFVLMLSPATYADAFGQASTDSGLAGQTVFDVIFYLGLVALWGAAILAAWSGLRYISSLVSAHTDKST